MMKNAIKSLLDHLASSVKEDGPASHKRPLVTEEPVHWWKYYASFVHVYDSYIQILFIFFPSK